MHQSVSTLSGRILQGVFVFLASVVGGSCSTPPAYTGSTPPAYPGGIGDATAQLRVVSPMRGGFWQGSPFAVAAALGDAQCAISKESGLIAKFDTPFIARLSDPKYGGGWAVPKHVDLGMIGGSGIPLADKTEIRIPVGSPGTELEFAL